MPGPRRHITETLSELIIAQVTEARVKSRLGSSFLETATGGVTSTGEANARDVRRAVMTMNFISRVGLRTWERSSEELRMLGGGCSEA